MADLNQKLTKILKELMEKTEVFIAILVDKNGLPIHSLDKKTGKPLKDEPEILAAGLSSSMLSLAEKSPEMINIDSGELNQMLIQSKKSMLIIREAGETALILVAVPANASLGITLLALKKAASDIAKLNVGPKEVKRIDLESLKIPDFK
ncbi:MAG: roadblock/LC7 domain-containing protein [Candidatus Helarchaeota archaeon]